MAQSGEAGPKYARFRRRLRGLMIDYVLFVIALVVALQATMAFESSELARVVGLVFVVAFILYEPLLVSFLGGTIGHSRANLRVVDDRTHGNVGLMKAFARSILKIGLGWYTFVSMTASRRHKAVHDILTRSTVQIRDPSIARPSDYNHERIELSNSLMPSRLRRLLVIAGYLAASLLVLVLVTGFVVHPSGLVSNACLHQSFCSAYERLVMNLIGLAYLAIMAICVGLGWRGRLWGARMRA